MSKEAFRVRFLESKVAIMELALKSSQCMANNCGVQAETLQRKFLRKEESCHRMEVSSNQKEEEVKKLQENVKELEEMLQICKRRITEQNDSNARLRREVSSKNNVHEHSNHVLWRRPIKLSIFCSVRGFTLQ